MTRFVQKPPRAIAHKQSQLPSKAPYLPEGNHTIPLLKNIHSPVAIALTHPHHFVLRNTTCDNIETAFYIWRVIDVR
ncbi:hypothetical protein IQ269_24320 [Tychonema sp. LEGE 07199]|uniref:hypothetical protein n=1 Tax=unclassified Tychonema TaxID=2642144 RepID=UPI00187F4EC6|nr:MULTISPECIES: hypothetical protein [unclassified Tychonema]MBE9123838.1 hypothetical protein [Tychonema sp. LEGE 07199]MBE9131260.1 hypothetical protein [Tychonema sp. LEGE 07196]